jgi:hypothetical protein
MHRRRSLLSVSWAVSLVYLGLVAAFCPSMSVAQAPGSCRGTRGAHLGPCKNPGGSCDAGSGPKSGTCQYDREEHLCDCVPVSLPQRSTSPAPSPPTPSVPPPWAGQCQRSSDRVIAVACTLDGQFKVELEVWIRNLLVYSSAGSELRFYGWSSHTGFLGLGGPGWAEFLVPPGPVSMHNTFSGVVGASGSNIGNAVQACGQGGQGLVQIQGAFTMAVRDQCFLGSAGFSVKVDAGANNGLPNPASASPGTVPQLTVQSVAATATVTINGESVSVGIAKIP